ncbi:unnamed protein product [Microthlaspi erraticum]|uniref:Uncharacterized protein n=1 Tax=Microthlaspi erraticum TaxID=1685480 RepID=A0A6D2KEN7_9BRAS|nr:unnamed protein product [Microthlaspi erraticum]
MLSLRSVITQATRGGRCVVSRRNFSLSSFVKETKESIGVEVLMELLPGCGYISIGFLLSLSWEVFQLNKVGKEAAYNEAKKLAMATSGSED